MFPHTVVHLTFRAPQIVVCGRVDTKWTYYKDKNILE